MQQSLHPSDEPGGALGAEPTRGEIKVRNEKPTPWRRGITASKACAALTAVIWFFPGSGVPENYPAGVVVEKPIGYTWSGTAVLPIA